MQTLTPIKRRTATIELTYSELAILDNCLFDGVVRLLKDASQFDYLRPEDAESFEGFQQDANAMRMLQRKLRNMAERT